MIYHKYRLGAIRRKRSRYSLHQRVTGSTSNERMLLEKLKKCLFGLAVLSTKPAMIPRALSMRNLWSCVACIAYKIHDLRMPRLLIPEPIVKRNININSFNDQSSTTWFGFSVGELTNLLIHLQIPEYFTLNSGRHAFKIPGEFSMLYFLFRMNSPSQRVALDSDRFGYDYSVLSKVYSIVLRHIHRTHKSLYRILPFAAHKLEYFNERIRTKITSDFPNRPLPVDAEACSLFADGTRFRVSRPSGAYWMQQSVYSGDKKFHNYGVQGIIGPDGLFYDIFDGPVGRHNDKRFMRDSDVNERLQMLQVGVMRQFIVYTDKGYYDDTHVRCAAHGPGALTAQEVADNGIMALYRIGVEWAFGKVRARVPYLTQSRLLKLRSVDVSMRVKVGFLLCNIHTCLHGSLASEYFNCAPPSLETYFSYSV